MGLSLHKTLGGPWERVRESLKQDLEHIESAVNRVISTTPSWPVNGIFITAVNTNPNVLLGFGVWALIATIAPGGGDRPRTLYIWEQTNTTEGQALSLAAGPPGSRGLTGRTVVWWADAGVPVAGLGSDGDMYLNTTTGDIYGPKATGVWGTAVANIMGPGGEDPVARAGGIGVTGQTQYDLFQASSATQMARIAGAASAVLVTDGSKVPSLATDLPTAVTIGGAYIHRVGGTDVAVADGGTAKSSWTQYSIPYASAATTVAEIAPAASSVLITSAGSVPSLAQTLPVAVQDNITRLGGISVPIKFPLGESGGLLPDDGSTVRGVREITVTALSASDVSVWTIGIGLLTFRDQTNGGVAICVTDVGGLVIIGQAGTTVWTLAAPGAAEIQIKKNTHQVLIRAGTGRNGTVVSSWNIGD